MATTLEHLLVGIRVHKIYFVAALVVKVLYLLFLSISVVTWCHICFTK